MDAVLALEANFLLGRNGNEARHEEQIHPRAGINDTLCRTESPWNGVSSLVLIVDDAVVEGRAGRG